MTGFIKQAVGMFFGWPLWAGFLVVTIVLQLGYYLGAPILYKVIFDDGIMGQDKQALVHALVGLTATLVVFALGSFAEQFASARLGMRATRELRYRMFEKIHALPPDALAGGGASDMADRLSRDMSVIETGLVRGFPNFLLQATVILTSTAMLFVIEWRLAAVAVGAMALVSMAPLPVSKRAEAANKEADHAGTALAGFTKETLDTHLLIWLLRLQGRRVKTLDGLLDDLSDQGARAHMLTGLIGRTAHAGVAIVQVVVIGVGGLLAFEGFMTPGYLVAFVGLLLGIGDAVNRLTNAIPLLTTGGSSLDRVNEILAIPPKVLERPGAEPMAPLSRDIAVEGVTFGYDPDAPVLKNVSLTIPAGKTAAFVGPSGCGKSTILSLIMRLHVPDAGRITFDGRDLMEITEDTLRHEVSVVPQMPILFEGSVADNIRMGKDDATDDEIVAAAKAAALHDDIKGMPKGYATSVGSGGGSLSGGQRQRVAIARALAADASVWVLDEATSALDPGSEDHVNQSVASLGGERTVLSVTHRLASIVDFDRIFVFEGGSLVEQGTHDELLAQGGLYHYLWQKQNGLSLDNEGMAHITAERLRDFEFLAGCDDALLEELAQNFVTEKFLEGRTVIHKGDEGSKFYVVVRGELEAFAPGEDGDDSRLGMLRDGDFFGEVALVEGQPRMASVRALTDTWCLSLAREHFLTLIEKNAAVKSVVIDAIRRRLGTVDSTESI
jgi:ATP-binding cassette subfamily B protein